MIYKWLNIFGLLITLSGGVMLALGLIITKRKALRIGVSRLAEDSDAINERLPHVQNEIRQSRFAAIGVGLFAIGIILQIISILIF
ncbi:MAG TPA: hypothetical protein VKA68_17370 [bacterium]|nr:hypothetical protein [bacterium]